MIGNGKRKNDEDYVKRKEEEEFNELKKQPRWYQAYAQKMLKEDEDDDKLKDFKGSEAKLD